MVTICFVVFINGETNPKECNKLIVDIERVYEKEKKKPFYFDELTNKGQIIIRDLIFKKPKTFLNIIDKKFVMNLLSNIFKDVLDQIVYLAILMPIVASMGGVAATQTLTIVLRGLTLEQINSSNLKWLFKRELAVSILNGLILSIFAGITTYLWFSEITLSLLISFALIINLVSSVIAGVFVPIILRSLNQDPAISGSVVVTTVTDVIGFLSFLGLATIFLI